MPTSTPLFKAIENDTNIQQTIKDTFDVALSVEGSWGYSANTATILNSSPNDMPLNQLEHMLTTLRAHIEMNLTQEEANRYGAINANEKHREQFEDGTRMYDKVTYIVTAMKEDLFKAFMLEYKEGYEKEEFDLNAHFKQREEATLSREVVHYFEVSNVQ